MDSNLDSPSAFSAPLTLDQNGLTYLEETRKWASFLAIMGFIGVGLMIILGLFMGTFFATFSQQANMPFPMQFLSIIYFVFAIIYFFPVWYLFRFARSMKIAIHEMNQERLTDSLSNLKSVFKFMGVVTIIILSIYFIVLISALLFGIFRNS